FRFLFIGNELLLLLLFAAVVVVEVGVVLADELVVEDLPLDTVPPPFPFPFRRFCIRRKLRPSVGAKKEVVVVVRAVRNSKPKSKLHWYAFWFAGSSSEIWVSRCRS